MEALESAPVTLPVPWFCYYLDCPDSVAVVVEALQEERALPAGPLSRTE